MALWQFSCEICKLFSQLTLNMGQARDIQLGKYQLKSRLGKGGMGVVYLATDSRLKRDVAVKILPRSLSTNPVAVKRFLREARVAASISHPSVVTIHDVDQINGQCFLVMELMTGGTAQDLIQEGPLDWREATRVIAETCQGLAAIHEAGLIHRDIKPSNIMLAGQGAVKLTDFGLAKITDSSSESQPLTLSNSILGTPQFMSPEQCQGDELDTRCDLYSLGATYFALLTGTAPFPDPQPLQCMFAHCSLPVPDPRGVRPEIPAESVAIIMQAMAKKRSDRFATAHDMLEALQACLRANGAESVTQARASSAKTAVGATQLPDSASFGKSSTSPGQSTFPLIDPGKTTVAIQDGRKKPFDRQRALQVTAGCSIVLLLGWMVWAFSGESQPQKSGVRSDPSAISGQTHANSPATRNTSAPNRPGLQRRLEFLAAIPNIQTMVHDVAFASDGRSFFSCGVDGTVRQWDVASQQEMRTFAGTNGTIRSVATNEKWVAAGGEADTVWLWNIREAQPRTTLSGLRGDVNALSFSPNGKRFAVGTDGEVNLYELDDSGARLIKVLGQSETMPVRCYMVESVSFSSDSRWVAATSWTDKAVAVWDAQTGVLRQHKTNLGDEPMAVVFIPHADRVVFSPKKGGVFEWDLNQTHVRVLPASQSEDAREVRSLAVTPDGRYVAAVGEWGGRICVYDLQQESRPSEATRHTGSGSLGMDISPDGTLLVTSGGDKDPSKGYIQLWKIVSGASE